jgi:hypothetical protein
MASKTRVLVSSGEYADDDNVDELDVIVIDNSDVLLLIVVDKELSSFVVVEDTSSAINDDDVYEDKGSGAAENDVTNAGRSIETTNIE